MIPYSIPIFITFISIFVFDIKNGKNGRIVWYFLYIYLTLLIGLRFEVGGDTINYMGYYQWQDDLDNFSFTYGGLLQPGYNFLCAISKSISPDFYIFQIIHAIIINTLLFIFIVRNTRYIFTTLFCLYFVCYFYFTCEILREAIAIMIFAYLSKPLMEKRWGVYFLGVGVCTLFHLSAFILIVFPLLTKIKFNRLYIILVIGVIFGMLFLNRLLGFAQDLLLLGDKVGEYANENHGYLADLLTFLRRGLFPIVFALVAKYGCKRNVIYENQIAVLGLFGIMAFFNPVIFGRITNYLIIFFVISFASEMILFIKSQKVSLYHNALVLSMSFLLLYSSYYFLYNMYHLYVPYSSVLDPVSYNRDNVNVFKK